jgi:hypothetical protein
MQSLATQNYFGEAKQLAWRDVLVLIASFTYSECHCDGWATIQEQRVYERGCFATMEMVPYSHSARIHVTSL